MMSREILVSREIRAFSATLCGFGSHSVHNEEPIDIFKRTHLRLVIHQTVVAKFFIQVKYFACTTSRNGLGP